MPKQHILFLNERPFNPILGGIERVTDTLCKELIKRGYTVSYLCGRVNTIDEQWLNYDFPTKLFTLPEYGLFKSNQNIEFYRNLLDQHKIDVVINQRGLNGGFNNALTIGNVKRISVIHSKPNSQINHNIARILLFSKEPKEQIKKYIKICLYPLFYLRAITKAKRYLTKAYRKLAERSDAIVLLSFNDIEELLSNRIDVSNTILCGIPNPNGFNLKSCTTLAKKEKTVLYVGRLDQFEKNLICLLKIWDLLDDKFPNWKLVIVGDGPDKKRLQTYIKKHNINNVYLEGSRSNVEDYYEVASFICLTSYYEGWGMSLTEGMQYGCIPFTFNNYGAASDIIDDGINGCLIKPYNIKSYAYRLSELMQNDTKRIQISNAAMEKVQRFSVDKVVDKWEELIKSLE